MNNIVALEPNNLIENIPEENFARKAFNRVISVVTEPRGYVACQLTLSIISVVILGAKATYESSNSITALGYYIGTAILNHPIKIAIAMIEGGLWLREEIKAYRVIANILPYNQLQQLPSDYKYNKDDFCPISYEKLEKGDTVCCDKHLYSYVALKESYIKCSKLIPHSLNSIQWNKNVYKLPEYSSK